MTSKEFIESINGDDETYRKLLSFLNDFTSGYSPQKMERLHARQVAMQNGYFWLPCLICGEWFGGQEEPSGVVMLTKRVGVTICTSMKCRLEAKRIKELYTNGVNG